MNRFAFPFLPISLLGITLTLGSTAPAQAEDPRLQEAVLAETAEGDAKKALALYTTLARAKDRGLARRAMLGQARLLQRLGRRDEAKALLEALATEQGQGQEQAKRALGQGGEKGRIAELIQDSRNSSAMEELVWIGEPAVPELIAILDEGAKRSVPINLSGAKVPREMRNCMRVLLRIGGKRAEAWLQRVVENGSATIRATVLESLSSQTDPELTRIAVRMTESDDDLISGIALAKVGRHATAERLVRLVLNGRPPQRVAAAEALNKNWNNLSGRVAGALAFVDAASEGRLPKTTAVRALIDKIRDDRSLEMSAAGRTARLRAWLMQPNKMTFGYDTETFVADENAEWLAQIDGQPGVGSLSNYINAVISKWTPRSAEVALHLIDQKAVQGSAVIRYWLEKLDRDRLPILLRRILQLSAFKGGERLHALLADPRPEEIAALAAAGEMTPGGAAMTQPETVTWLLSASDHEGAIRALSDLATRGERWAMAVASACIRAEKPALFAACVPLVLDASVDQDLRRQVLRTMLRTRPSLLRGKVANIAPLAGFELPTPNQRPAQSAPTGLAELVNEGLEKNPELFLSALLGRRNGHWPDVADVAYPRLLKQEGSQELVRWVRDQPQTDRQTEFWSAAIRNPRWVATVVEHGSIRASASDIEPLLAYLGKNPGKAVRVGNMLVGARRHLGEEQLGVLLSALEPMVREGPTRGSAIRLITQFDTGRAVTLLTELMADDNSGGLLVMGAWKVSGDPRFAPLLSKVVASSDGEVRKQAQEGLELLDAATTRQREASRQRALSTLIEQAKKPGKAQLRAIRALGHLTAPEAVLTLVELAGSDNPEVAQIAEAVLSK